MRNILIYIIVLFVLPSSLAYAQYGDYYDGKNSYTYDEMNAKKKKTSSSPSAWIPRDPKFERESSKAAKRLS